MMAMFGWTDPKVPAHYIAQTNRESLEFQRQTWAWCARHLNARVLIGKHLPAWNEKAMEINRADVAELVDARDLKSLDGNVVWVRVPPPAPKLPRQFNRQMSVVEGSTDFAGTSPN